MFTSLQKSALHHLFENFFACIATSTFQNTIIHADFLHIITFYLISRARVFQGLSILVMLKLEILPLILPGSIMISDVNLLHLYTNNTVQLFLTTIHYSFTVSLVFINTALYYIILFITLKQRMRLNS